MSSLVEVVVVELRRAHPSWGPRRLHFELGRRELVEDVPSESAIYRCLVRHHLIDPDGRRRRVERWRRWEPPGHEQEDRREATLTEQKHSRDPRRR